MVADVSKAVAVSHSLSVENGYGLDFQPSARVSKATMRVLNMPTDSAHQESEPFGAILQEHGLQRGKLANTECGELR